MAAASLYSTVTLCAEIVISAIILFVFYEGYAHKRFRKGLAAFALGYETLFNISYMVFRSVQHIATDTGQDSAVVTALAIIHGILSLVMFVSLVIFLVLAWRAYDKKRNFFKDHRIVTWTFIMLWLLSVFSGIVFYFVLYG